MKSKRDIFEPMAVDFKKISGFLSDGEKVRIDKFGNFEVRERAERKGRNPQTGKEITITAKKSPVFKAGKGLKEKVNKA